MQFMKSVANQTESIGCSVVVRSHNCSKDGNNWTKHTTSYELSSKKCQYSWIYGFKVNWSCLKTANSQLFDKALQSLLTIITTNKPLLTIVQWTHQHDQLISRCRSPCRIFAPPRRRTHHGQPIPMLVQPILRCRPWRWPYRVLAAILAPKRIEPKFGVRYKRQLLNYQMCVYILVHIEW